MSRLLDAKEERKTKKSVSPTASRREWRGWIDYPLTKEQLETIKSLDCSPEWFAMWLSRVVDDGLAVSFKEDTYNECYQATLTVVQQTHRDAGIGLTGRGSTIAKAFRQAIYIHSELLDGDWTAFMDHKGDKVKIDD